ncbi:ABC transporter permease subunit [Cohnella rhizosphaerae]|uniref:ABC transporter permease subunit n=1 Tax=Cohnella rhizosphaerae TaxID=1457232 RepID=UPI003B8A77BD
MPTILNVTGLQFGALLASSVLVETVFSWPGVGQVIYQAIGQRDFPRRTGRRAVHRRRLRPAEPDRRRRACGDGPTGASGVTPKRIFNGRMPVPARRSPPHHLP